MTPLLAASASTDIPLTGWLWIAAGLWLLGYTLACLLWPWTSCGACGGTGRRGSPTGTAWRTCGRCGGRGAHLRLGRRLFTSTRDRWR